MFFAVFDWKIKLGMLITATLLLGSIISFIYAWTAPVPTDAYTALDKYMSYRWFAFFIFSTFSIGGVTVGYHHKQLNRF